VRGRLIATAGVLCAMVLALPVHARAQQAVEATATPGESGEGESGAPGGDIELGGRMGVTTGGRATAGGLRFGGVLLYRLSSIDWFEGALDFTVGAGSAACFRDRTGEFLCNHGSVSGRSLELGAGIRRFLAPREQFTPYAAVRLGARILSFPGDDVAGFAIPLTAGAGVRARVSELVAIGGGVAVELGLGWFTRDLGLQPQLGLTVQVGAELQLR
jgi:hypothetical protein